jgi:biopolymer transport protein ExbD
MIDMTAEKKLPRELCELPLTPMIDVVFLLNTFFVGIHYRALAGELEARLPRTPGVVSRVQPEDELFDNHIWVKVTLSGTWSQKTATDPRTGRVTVAGDMQPVLITVNGQPVGDFDALQYELSSKHLQLGGEGKKPMVILELDPRLMFQNVVSTVNAAKKAKFASISFTPPAGVPKE